MISFDNTVELRVPIDRVRENAVKVIGLLLSIMELEQFGNLDIAYKIIIRYGNNNILRIENTIDNKILKSILYYIKLTNSRIISVTKEYDNSDYISISIHEDCYMVKVDKKYSEIIKKKIELMEVCKLTEHDTIDCINIDGIDRDLLISTISKRIKVRDCISVMINGLTVNIIKSMDITLMIDMDNIYIVDLYNDFRTAKKILQSDIEALVNSKSKQKENRKSEYCFI